MRVRGRVHATTQQASVLSYRVFNAKQPEPTAGGNRPEKKEPTVLNGPDKFYIGLHIESLPKMGFGWQYLETPISSSDLGSILQALRRKWVISKHELPRSLQVLP